MSAEFDKLRDIFHEAVERLPQDQWDAYLSCVCAGDDVLRLQAAALLQAHAQSRSVIDPGPGRTGGEPTAAHEVVAEAPGVSIGPYKLMQEIGEGGMGSVWMAQQTEPVKRLVALKVIKAGMDSRQVLARFEAERQALALMDHPNIAKVLDVGSTTTGRPYFVMELVKGVPITKHCDEHRLTPKDRLELFVPVCRAIQHAHQKGIIHRDIKPTNVLVALYDGRPVPKVIDFGVAKATLQPLTDRTLFTGFGAVIGTPEYMSPEQAELNQLDIDTRSDIYSLGVLLYELLAGSTPFSRKELEKVGMLEMLRVIREQEPSKPSMKLSTAAGLPTLAANRGTEPAKLTRMVRGELDWIVMKALEKDRNRRYETANGLAADVQRFLCGEAVMAVPPSARYRLRKFARRNKRVLVSASLLAALLLLLLVGIPVTAVLRHERDRALDQQGRAERAEDQARAAEKENKIREHLARAGAFRRGGQSGQRIKSLWEIAEAVKLGPSPDLRDELRTEAIAAMALPDVRHGPPWHASPPGYNVGAFDGDYRLYARGDDKGVISIRSLPDDREIQNIVSAPTRRGLLLLSPDGRYLANLEDGDTLKVWRVDNRAAVLREEPRQTYGWAFSPDSRHLAIGQKGWILRFDLATGQEVNRWRLPDQRYANALAFHPDNRRLAVGYQNANVTSVYDATNGDLVAHLPIGANVRQVVAWHPDGERLAVAGAYPPIQIWNVPATRKVATIEGHSPEVTILTFHPKADLLATHAWDGITRLWDPASGRELLHFTGTSSLRFSTDGRWVGTAWHGEHAQLLEVTPTREYRTLVGGRGAGQDLHQIDSDISPDGRLLALNMHDAVRLWQLPSGRELAVLSPGRPRFQSNGELLIASPDGLHRWPINAGAAANELIVGPPRTVVLPIVPIHTARSEDGRSLALMSEMTGSALLLDLATDSIQTPRFDLEQSCYVALSPDGRWLATTGWHSDRVRLWNAKTGEMVHEWKAFRQMIFFTPDSRALIISHGDAYSFHDVETRQPVRPPIRRDVVQYPSHVAFSPGGRLMALEMGPGIVHLKDVDTARTVAKLEDPHGDLAGWMSFTPDGTQLVVAAPNAKAVHVWDLRAIRQRLKGMGLDWDWPEFPQANPGEAQTPLKVEVRLGPVLTREQKAKLDISAFRQAFEKRPDNPNACNSLAWVYLTVPESLRDVKAAIPLAEKAVRLKPEIASYVNTLGVAYYRNGRHRAAVDTLRPNLVRGEDGSLAYDLYFLAMSHHKLGETALARAYFDWAISWARTDRRLTAGQIEELELFRAEATELLGVADRGRVELAPPPRVKK